MEPKKSLYFASAVCSALSMASATGASAVGGYHDATTKHCYGAALAGQNDCGADRQTCKGTAQADCDLGDWKFAKSEEECKALIAKNCPQNQ
jgi:uncharacterized membrane protein